MQYAAYKVLVIGLGEGEDEQDILGGSLKAIVKFVYPNEESSLSKEVLYSE